MDEEEIDAWYEEQKEWLTEKCRLKIEKARDKERLKRDFTKKLMALQIKYEKISTRTSDSNLWWFFFNYRLSKLKDRLMKPVIQLKEKYFDKDKKPES
jgi:hypothetical protein